MLYPGLVRRQWTGGFVFNTGNAGYNKYGCPAVYPHPLLNMHVAEQGGYCTPGGGSHTAEPSSHWHEADDAVVEILSMDRDRSVQRGRLPVLTLKGSM